MSVEADFRSEGIGDFCINAKIMNSIAELPRVSLSKCRKFDRSVKNDLWKL